MQRFNQRQGFLVSAILHLTILMILISTEYKPRPFAAINPNALERKEIVFLPSREELRRMLPPERPASPKPTPAPTPVPTPATDRISIGPRSDVRLQGPVQLRPDEDLTKALKGQADAALVQTPPPSSGAPAQGQNPQQAARANEQGREGLRLPAGLGNEVRGDERARLLQPPSLAPSIAGAVEDLTRRAEQQSRAGSPTGTGQSIGGLYFDPQGADFTLWASRFRDEVYRNWIAPQVALFGAARGHVDFEFVVERDGSVSTIRLLKSSGTPSLDRAARNALTGSRLSPLPDAYGPPRLTILVSFYYNEAPQGS